MTRYLVAVATCLLLWLAIGATKAVAEDVPPDEEAQSEVDAVEAGPPAGAEASTEARDEAAGEESEQGEGSDEGGSESGPPTQDSCDDCNGDQGADEATGEEQEREPVSESESESDKQPVVNFVVSAWPQGQGGEPVAPLYAPPIVPEPNGLAQSGGGLEALLAAAQRLNEPADGHDQPGCGDCQSGSGEPDVVLEEEEDRDRLAGRRRARFFRIGPTRRGVGERRDTSPKGPATLRPDPTVAPAEAIPRAVTDRPVRHWPPEGKDEREFGPAWASVEARRAGLTDREWDVLSLLVTGASTREIAWKLYISPRTVTNHLVHIYDKLGVRSRAKVLVCVLGMRPDRPAQ